MPTQEIWEEAEARLRASRPYRDLLAGASRADRLPVAAAAWVGELLKVDHQRPLLVVAPREADALAWLEATALFGGEGIYLPAPSLTPYQEAEVSLMVRAEEVVALDRLLTEPLATVVCTPRTLFRRWPSPQQFEARILEVESGRDYLMTELAERLVSDGYQRTDLVSEVGDFALRGGVLDLYPPGPVGALRLDFFGDTLDSLRCLNTTDQRSRDDLESARVLPLTLHPSGGHEAEELADLIAQELGADASLEVAQAVESLRRADGFPGWENLLPVGGDEGVELGRWRPDALLVTVDSASIEHEIDHHHQLLTTDFEARRKQRRLALRPELLERPVEAVREAVAAPDLTIGDLLAGGDRGVDFAATATDSLVGQLPRFRREVETQQARDERTIIVAGDDSRRRLEEFLRGQELEVGRGGVELVSGQLRRGFRLPMAGVALYGDGQLFSRRPARRRRSAIAPFVSQLRDLRVGDYIVHIDHGIGRFLGLRSVGPETTERPDLPPVLVQDAAMVTTDVEVMEIAYKGDRRLLIPLGRLEEIQKYSGVEGMVPHLDRLGGTSWNRTKARVRRGMLQLAGDLLKLYAERQLARAPALPPDDELQAEFADAFEFEETEDQLTAMAAIRDDLERERPMDRLLCGDVGFGKTEVAMRAAFKAVAGGHQVAVLAPTTILADQHLQTFRRRCGTFGARVEMISRFRSAAEVREVRRRVAAGEIDILIGTHRLLSRDIEIPKLGLLIVDEEQRFGVAQKERVKRWKKSVHVLAMSATPVPRTLQLSLAGVRDLSSIETPPRDRMAVETAVLPFSGELIREAIEFELERDGQIFFVYNRVQGIEQIAGFLRELVPELRLTIGHGQLPEGELARRMHAFQRREHDLLLATTIIENGIDLANVNTIIVHRADRFGMAQLYQLRGRVGRSDRLAYCYLLVKADRVLSQAARSRLAALREFTELGAGFRIAARDLEIRGAGNLLGAEQSGHIVAVGIETYLKMLEETVRELKGEAPDEPTSVALDLSVALAIPTDYIGDVNLRMEIYRKLGSGRPGPDELLVELRDRFGPPPEDVRRLLAVGTLKATAEQLRVQSISARGGRLRIQLRHDSQVDVERLVEMVSERPDAKFSPTGVLTVESVAGGRAVRVAQELLEELSRPAGGGV